MISRTLICQTFCCFQLIFWSIEEQTVVISILSNQYKKHLNLIFTFGVCMILRKSKIIYMLWCWTTKCSKIKRSVKNTMPWKTWRKVFPIRSCFKYVPKSTLSSWLKNKKKIFSTFEQFKVKCLGQECMMMWIRLFLSDLILKKVNRYLLMNPCLRKRQQILQKPEIFQVSHRWLPSFKQR